jgi:hypothetical protein
MDVFPNVLILNCTFDSLGSGITIQNLFRTWPKTKLGNAHAEIIKNEVCSTYFQIGDRASSSHGRKEMIKNQVVDLNSYKNNFVKKLTIGFKKHLELKHIINKKSVDEKFIDWVKSNKFDMVYFVLFEARDIPFLLEFKKKINLPIATHIFDNWVEHNRFGFFRNVFAPFLLKDFKKAINASDICLAISREMKNAYQKKFKKKFYVFHNPSEDFFKRRDQKPKRDYYTITFVGTIGEHNYDIFEKIGLAIETLKSQKILVKLKFIGYIRKAYIHEKIKKISSLRICTPMNNKDIANELVNSDILLLPLSFEASQKDYIKYSMPTKTSEYMASGVPVLVLAPEDYSLTKYALKEKWAQVLTNCNVDELSNTIRNLCCDYKLKKYYQKQSRKIFLSHHKVEYVSEKLRKVFVSHLRKDEI